MTPVTCNKCRIVFGVPAEFEVTKRQDGSTFYCPHGHSLFWPLGESETDRLRRERDRAVQEQARVEEERRAAVARAERAEKRARRVEKRSNAGVCLHCGRSFAALRRHMATKHPEMVCEAAS